MGACGSQATNGAGYPQVPTLRFQGYRDSDDSAEQIQCGEWPAGSCVLAPSQHAGSGTCWHLRPCDWLRLGSLDSLIKWNLQCEQNTKIWNRRGGAVELLMRFVSNGSIYFLDSRSWPWGRTTRVPSSLMS